MKPCKTCAHPKVAFDRKISLAPGAYGVWVQGCPVRKIRFGTFAEIAAGELDAMPDSCDDYREDK